MATGKRDRRKETAGSPPLSIPERSCHGRILSVPERAKYLDPLQLHQLETSFRRWSEAATRVDVRMSRRRVFLIFMLIRYTGAKLSEVLGVDPHADIDFDARFLRLGGGRETAGRQARRVQLSEALCREIEGIVSDAVFQGIPRGSLEVDPGFVRRKFYERAQDCGIPKRLAAPEALRRARGVELMQSNMPLPAVQMLLGHSTPNLTSAYVSFSEDDVDQVTRFFVERESARKTSARNAFFGKIQVIRKGDIQARVELLTVGGLMISTVITNDSLQRLGLKVGMLITAEVKAPWVMLQRAAGKGDSSADNVFEGRVERILEGEISTEFVVRISDGSEVCAIVTSDSRRRLALAAGEKVRVLFNSFAVVLMSE